MNNNFFFIYWQIFLSLTALAITNGLSLQQQFQSQIYFPIYRNNNFQIDRSDGEKYDQDTYSTINQHQQNNYDNTNGNYNNYDLSETTQDDNIDNTNNELNNPQPQYTSYADFNNEHNNNDIIRTGHNIYENEQSIPISEHVEVTKPVTVPVYKEIGILLL